MTYNEAVEFFYGKKPATLVERLEAQTILFEQPQLMGDIAMHGISHRALRNISEALLIILRRT